MATPPWLFLRATPKYRLFLEDRNIIWGWWDCAQGPQGSGQLWGQWTAGRPEIKLWDFYLGILRPVPQGQY